MSKKLPAPAGITPEAIREVFEAHGYETVAKKQVSIDVYELITPLLIMLQWVQWWGELLAINGRKVNLEMDVGFQAMTTHAAEHGHQVCVVPCSSVDDVLNMPRTWFRALRQYGTDPGIRSERLDDTGYTEAANELLDAYGQELLHLLSLVLPPRRSDAGAAETR